MRLSCRDCRDDRDTELSEDNLFVLFLKFFNDSISYWPGHSFDHFLSWYKKMMKMGGEDFVTDDDLLTRMSKRDNKPF